MTNENLCSQSKCTYRRCDELIHVTSHGIGMIDIRVMMQVPIRWQSLGAILLVAFISLIAIAILAFYATKKEKRDYNWY